ncbi:AraC family transcriptional regulator [Xaviernesmea oryzae]|uniref:AraC family transcriptional regulator n=1 Tax=Xaviernesmea oryzae TaxID=464029 RepID=A0A1Q9AYN5_9HYPH|nr:AraC family transcriptional regulator [Xaviernesmea oryzae]OLP60558.1 AraC family transcriptional regulator [Xaviernesmea oryzae]SEM31026.1 Helix-turn-helix domain-containing protein [Xaviernesmea oryzae]
MNDTLRTLTTFVAQRTQSVLTRAEMPRVEIYRVTQPTKLLPEIYQPFVSLILQGSKRLMIGTQVLDYAAGNTFVASVALPAIGEVIEASVAVPYLAVLLRFDLTVIADLLRDVPGSMDVPHQQSFRVDPASDDLVDAWLRMMRLMDRPDDIAVMAPLLEREILFRLLQGPQGVVLRQAATAEGRFSQIRATLSWVRTNYARPFQVEDLADMANMSPSAFHRRFKASTGLSPLQYQKHLRLYEARRILFAQPGDVAAVAFAVGYESLSQFTREYARLFGAPPASDIRDLRAPGSRNITGAA